MLRNNRGCDFGRAAAVAFSLGILGMRMAAAQGTPPPAPAARPTAPRDEYQRSADIYRYQTAAKSGPGRGEAIYYYKCWICHNQYTATGGPHLKGIFARRTFATSSEPVNDQTVKNKIRNGGPGMPRFVVLTDADLEDVVSYLKDSKCCFEGAEPPPNPRYRAR